MADLQYSDVIPRLLQALPDIRGYYEKRCPELYAENNPYVIYGFILVEYMNGLAAKLGGPRPDTSERMLRDAFGLIEELSASSDFQTRCLAETGVLEALLGEKGGLEQFAAYMGPETKKLARVVADAWSLNTQLLS
jgi:hypothetical protein